MKTTTGAYGTFSYFAPDAIGQRLADGVFHDEHLRPYLDALKPGDVFVDVGANIGFHSIYAAKRGATVHAFEPAVDVAALLRENIKQNNLLDKIWVHNVALYDSEIELMINPAWTDWSKKEDGSVDYNNSPNSGGLSLVKGNGGFHARVLDGWFLRDVALIKVDTQGSDLCVLFGARDLIRSCQPTVCFEFEHEIGSDKNAAGDTLDAFLNFFEGLKYHVYPLTPYGDDTSWTDFVAEPNR